MGERGFTFIEAVLMMFVIGIGSFGLMTAFATANRMSMDANLTITAAMLAQEKMDRIVADKAFFGYNYLINGNYPAENLAGAYRGQRRSVNIREVKPDDLTTPEAGAGIKRVEIEVRWGPANTQAVKLTTLLASYL